MGEFDTSVIKKLVLLLIILMIMLFFVGKIAKHSYDVAQKANCKESVKNNARRLVVAGTDLTDKYGSTAPVNCRTTYATITKTKDRAIKEEIARYMFDSWDMFGRGELEIFATEDENFCVITHVLEFKKKGELKDFTTYLLNTTAPNIDKTYYDFFAGKHISGEVIVETKNLNLDESDTINLDKELAIVFVMDKDAHLGKVAAGLWVAHNLNIFFGVSSTTGGAAAEKSTYLLARKTGSSIVYPASSDYILHEMSDEAMEAMVKATSSAKNTAAAESAIARYGTKALRIGGKTFRTVGSYLLLASIGVGVTGFLLGEDHSADWDARILLLEYEELKNLKCTYLEGRAGYIAQVDFE